MTSAFSNKVAKLYAALMNRINDSISAHNASNDAHQSLFSAKANSSDLTTLAGRVSNLEDELDGLEEDLLA